MKYLAAVFLVFVFPAAVFAASDNSQMNNATIVDPNQQVTSADRELEKKIQLSLVGNSKFVESLNGVKIIAQDGRVILQGTVSTDEQKKDYTDQVQKVLGVEGVENQLLVSEP